MGDGENDYDRIARDLGEAIDALIGNMHEPHERSGDSVTITKDGALTASIRLVRLKAWVHGLAESTRLYASVD